MAKQYLLIFLSNVASTIMGGLILAFLFFLAHEKLFPLPTITGQWHMEMRFDKSSCKPYDGMVLQYVVVIWREGSNIKGSAEKVYESSSTGKRSYTGTKRTRSVIEGYADKNIFSSDRVLLHIVEDGRARESTHFQELTVGGGGDRMTGLFSSMTADSKGVVTWQREPF